MTNKAYRNILCRLRDLQVKPDIYQIPVESNSDELWDPNLNNLCGMSTLKGLSLTVSQLYGLFVKRIMYYIRNYRIMVVQTAVPLCLLWTGLAFLEIDASVLKTVSLTTKDLSGATVAYADSPNGESSVVNLMGVYRETVASSGGKFLRVSSVENLKSLTTSNLLVPRNTAGADDVFIGAIFDKEDNIPSSLVNITALYNVQAYHSEPVAVAVVMKALHRYCTLWDNNKTVKDEDAAEPTLNLVVQPLPLLDRVKEIVDIRAYHEFCMNSSILVLASMTFLTSIFTFILVKERMVKLSFNN